MLLYALLTADRRPDLPMSVSRLGNMISISLCPACLAVHYMYMEYKILAAMASDAGSSVVYLFDKSLRAETRVYL